MRALIVNADDLGYDPAVTRGLVRALREGVVSSCTLMVNTPFSEAAARDAQGLAVGLHLNLARGAPVWDGFPRAWLRPDGTLDEARAGALPADVVEREADAQLERAERLLGRAPTHADVHKHLHRHPAVLEGLARAAARRALPVRSLDAGQREVLRRHGVPTNDHFLGEAGSEAYWTPARLREALLHEVPARGVTELMCHPGHAPETLKSGYGAQREVELATFLLPEARAWLAEAGLVPTSFAVLARGT